MAHIAVNEQLPGIAGLLHFRSETAKLLNELAEILLRGESILTRGEREVITSYVSHKNNCHFRHSAQAYNNIGKMLAVDGYLVTTLNWL